jgi:hypothetical protein
MTIHWSPYLWNGWIRKDHWRRFDGDFSEMDIWWRCVRWGMMTMKLLQSLVHTTCVYSLSIVSICYFMRIVPIDLVAIQRCSCQRRSSYTVDRDIWIRSLYKVLFKYVPVLVVRRLHEWYVHTVSTWSVVIHNHFLCDVLFDITCENLPKISCNRGTYGKFSFVPVRYRPRKIRSTPTSFWIVARGILSREFNYSTENAQANFIFGTTNIKYTPSFKHQFACIWS